MTLPSFELRWERLYGATPPVGYWLRAACPSRWVRVHSLPGAKRYPTSDAEWETLLFRHESVARTVLGDGPVVLVVARFYEGPVTDSLVRFAEGLPLELELLERLTAAVPPGDEAPFGLFGCESALEDLRFPDLLRAVANDEPGPTCFVNAASLAVYAPYDGGADVFAASENARDRLRERWSAWLSSRADGL